MSSRNTVVKDCIAATLETDPYYNCRECGKSFQPNEKNLIQKGYFPIWECPHCGYPNDSADLEIIK